MPVAQNEKTDVKTVLLFVPGELLKKFAVFHLLHIRKADGKIDYTLSAINSKELQQHGAFLPTDAIAELLSFGQEALAAFVKETEQRCKKQKAGISVPAFVGESVLRHLHRRSEKLKPFFSTIRCYHKIPKNGNQALQMLPCTFSTDKPELRFSIVGTGPAFVIDAEVGLNGVFCHLREFSRTAFFLQKDNLYYLLSYPDFQTLEWLHQQWQQQGQPDLAFLQKILARLENDYPVNRNNLLQERQITGVPRCRVYLSELNGAFLLLTPQWVYDGMMVEGPWREKQEYTAGGERMIIFRHREAEEQFLQQLSSLHPGFANQRNGYYYLTFTDAKKKQWFAHTFHQLLEQDVEIVGMDMLHHFRYSPFKAETTVAVQDVGAGFLVMQLTVRFGKETVPLPALQKTLHAGQRAVVLKDGSLGVLSDEWLAEYAMAVKHGRLKEGKLLVSKFVFFREHPQQSWKPNLNESWWQKWRQWQQGSDNVYALPASVKATLRPYQQKGFEWMALLAEAGAGACLADDMGLGKTLQTICFLAWYTEQHPNAKHLVVCPTSLLYNWQQELKKFAPGLRTMVFHNSGNDGGATGAQVIITSFGTLRNHSEFLLAPTYGVAVIDESHNIKNPSAQITRVAQHVQAAVRLALSGTPVVNNTFDLYTQLSFALPGLLGSREFFKREYADAIDRYGDEGKIKALQHLTAPFILRRTKEQVAADLPPKTETVLWCDMTAEQEELYEEVKQQIRSNLFLEIEANGLQKTKLAVLQGLLKLRQICNDPRLLPTDEHAGRLHSAKTAVLMDELRHLLAAHRVLLFSQFSSMLHLLAGECQREGIAYFLLDGQTPAEKRTQMVKAFQENAGAPPLFLISLKAGNTGLTLTAADYVFLFDPWWNTAVEQQAVDRTHRIGQTKNVFSYKLICRNTVEEKILALQQRKKLLAEELITPEEAFVKNLSQQDVDYLFS